MAEISAEKSCTTTMAAEPVFLDTSLIVAATVEVHPSHKVAVAFVDTTVERHRAEREIGDAETALAQPALRGGGVRTLL